MAAPLSPGSGGTIGGPPTLSARELEATAATQVAKQQQGITADSLGQHFAKLDLDGKFKYKSAASNPSLAPLVKTRIGMTTAKDIDMAAWNETLSRLVDYLPGDVRRELIAQSQLPTEERNPAYGSLDRFLGNTTTLLLWLNTITEPLDPAQIANSHVLPYGALTELVAASTIVNMKEILFNARTAMLEMGHNNPNFDAVINLTTQIDEKLKEFQELSSGQIDKTKMAQLASTLDTLNVRLESLSIGNDLQILRPSLNALTTIATAMSLETKSNALLLGLSLGMIGVSQNNSSAGLLSTPLTKMLESFSEGILGGVSPNATTGQKELFSHVTTTLFSTVTLLSLLANTSLSSLDIRLALQQAVNGGLLSGIGSNIANLFVSDSRSKAVLGDTLSLSMAMLMIKIAGASDPDLQGLMAKDIKSMLQKWLESIQVLGERNAEFAVHLETARRQLEEDKDKDFLKTEELLEQLAMEEDRQRALQDDYKQFYEFLATLKYIAGHKYDLKSNDTSLIVA